MKWKVICFQDVLPPAGCGPIARAPYLTSVRCEPFTSSDLWQNCKHLNLVSTHVASFHTSCNMSRGAMLVASPIE